MSEEFVPRHEYLEYLMQECILCLEHYPADYSPIEAVTRNDDTTDDDDTPSGTNYPHDTSASEPEETPHENEFMELISSLKKMADMSSPQIDEETLHQRIHTLMEDWPPKMFLIFLDCSRVISSAILEMANDYPELSIDHAFNQYEAHSGDDFITKLLASAAGIALPDQDPFTEAVPFRETLTLLLGPKAAEWLSSPVDEYTGKLQPHELSRVNWIKLNNIKQQINVELELKQLMALAPLEAKTVVAAAWTMVALASYMNPKIFYFEAQSYISSLKDGNITVSTGNNQDILNFQPQSMITLVKVLKEAFSDEYLEANDLMWIAAGVAKETSISTKFDVTQAYPLQTHFEMFLSHRGKDAKKQLMEQVIDHKIQDTIFLDCLSLPYRIINRNFVFKNLVRSKRILIVQTKNYDASIWCCKEASVANILSSLGLCEVIKVPSVDSATEQIDNITALKKEQKTPHNSSTVPADEHTSWITTRIMRDIDYHGRQPNLYSAKEQDLTITCFESLLTWLMEVNEPDYDQSIPDGETIAQKVRAMYQAFFHQASEDYTQAHEKIAMWLNAPLDLWFAANQLTIAALSLKTHSYNKMDTRYRIDCGNTITANLVNTFNHLDIDTLSYQRITDAMLLMSAAITLELAEQDRKSIAQTSGIKSVLTDIAIEQEGLLLIDTRIMNDEISFLLNNVVINLVTNDIGSIGILQNADAPVHESIINGFSLDVLPCVTLHPGMDRLYEQFKSETT